MGRDFSINVVDGVTKKALPLRAHAADEAIVHVLDGERNQGELDLAPKHQTFIDLDLDVLFEIGQNQQVLVAIQGIAGAFKGQEYSLAVRKN